MKFNYFTAVVLTILLCLENSDIRSQNVGIGTSTPEYKLDVNGSIHSASNIYLDGNIGVGYTNAESITYRMLVKNGSLAIYNSGDNLTWRMHYEEGLNRLSFSQGTGTSTTSARMSIDNSGTVTAHNGIAVTGNATISGNAVVGGDKPVVRAGTVSGGNIKIHNASYTVTAILAGHAQSAEFSINWAAGIFNNRPTVLVGNEISTGGTLGQLYRVFVKVYDCTNTGCKARLINTSPNSINYDITFDVMMIGD